MTGWLRDFRLIPIVLVAIGCLLALKTVGLLSGSGYTLGQRLGGSGTLVVTTVPAAPVTQLQSPAVPLDVASAQSPAQRSWMQEMFNYPGDITGSIANVCLGQPQTSPECMRGTICRAARRGSDAPHQFGIS